MRFGLFARAAGVALATAALVPAGARAEEVTVSSAADDGGSGTLRTLIDAANADDVINIPDPRTLTPPADRYLLTQGPLTIADKNLSLHGAGARSVTIDAGQSGRVLSIESSGTNIGVIVTDVTITGGKPASGDGGGIRTTDKTDLTLSDVVVTGNVVDSAGTSANGGGIALGGTGSLYRVLVTGNTLVDNGGFSYGGGIWAGSTLFVTDSTVAGNLARTGPGGSGTFGGGIAARGGGSITVQRSTVVGNHAQGSPSFGGNLSAVGGLGINIKTSIVSDGTATDPTTANCTDGVDDYGGNVLPTAGGCAPAADSGSVAADPQIDWDLRNNGGPTDTLRPLPGSPAIDRNPGAGCVSQFDQRKLPRPFGDKCDAGAYEVMPPQVLESPPTPVTSSGATVTASVATRGPAGTVRAVYGTRPDALGSSSPEQPLPVGSGPVAVTLGGLLPNQTYYAALVATTPDGTATGPVTSFTTSKAPPAVVTGEATAVGQTTAVLGGTVDAKGAETKYRFLLGRSGGSLDPLPERSAGAGRDAAPKTEDVTGLAPGTTYSYRIVASNEAGSVEGEIRTFTTAAAVATPTPTPGASPGPTPTAPAPTPTPAPTPSVTPPRPPTLSRLSLSPGSPRARFKKATIKLTLAGGTGAATVRFTVEKRGKRNRYQALKGSFSKRFTKTGALTLSWNGKVGGKRLGKGTYRLVAVAMSSAGVKAKPVRKAFVVR